ncbi:MAG: putative sugar nucleotidyl transferase [Gemmatimonadales bacterium]
MTTGTTGLYLYDDDRARGFEPFASARPISEMRAGAWLIRERWRAILDASAAWFAAGERHADFDEPGAAAAAGTIPAGSVLVNARCVPALPSDPAAAARRAASCSMWRCGDRLAAVRLRDAVDSARLADGAMPLDSFAVGTGAIGTVDGWWLDEVWDFIRLRPEQLASDLARIVAVGSSGVATMSEQTGDLVLGDHAVLAAQRTTIEPNVLFDATAGPIVIDAGSHVRAFTRITGPCYIGREVSVMGGDITACSIGDLSKVRGELSNTIVLGHSNKGHDGFVGHSYLGRWVNVGAGTITSNLKNTYGAVSLWTPSGVRDTGLQFLGTLFGDHVKTGIGLRLTTGTVLGAGANVYGSMPPKVVPPFAWGDAPPYATYQADKFVETASRMMARRHVELSTRARRHLSRAHEARWSVPAKDEPT